MFGTKRFRTSYTVAALIGTAALVGVAGLFAVDTSIAVTEHAYRSAVAATAATVTVPDASKSAATAGVVGAAAESDTLLPATSDAAPATPVTTATPLRVLAIGDSVMKGFGLSPASAWPELLAGNNGWDLTSLACDGAGFLTVGSERECDDTFLGVAEAADTVDPDLIIIEGSSNDYGQPDAELAAATTKTLALLRAKYPDARIIGLSAVWTDTLPDDQVEAINAQVSSAVAAVGGSYFDIGQPLSGHPEIMQADDVHPTAAGQLILADSIQAAMNSGFTAAKTALLVSSASQVAH